MKKTLALVLALAMVFSTITVAFAEDTLGADAQICANLGMLKGETGTVDAAYVATAPTRLQAAIMFLRLKGLEAEALAFTGAANFGDAGQVNWAGGKAIMAYLKANPQLGWQGDGTNFSPNKAISAQEYYKVMLEALGYKQTTPEVVGDFAYADVFTFAASVGLSKVATVTNFTVNDVAIATVEALKLNVKDGDKTLAATLVEAGKIDKAAAVAAGLYTEAATTTDAKLDTVRGIGNDKVLVKFDAEVEKGFAENVANYSITEVADSAKTLEVKAVALDGTKRVVLETAAMTAGKAYKLTVVDQSMNFAGVAKDTGAPEIDKVEGTDTERVVITFSKGMDMATALDAANYAIAGATIESVVWDDSTERDSVELTAKGLVANKTYKVTVTNVKSVDLVVLKSASKSFVSKSDKKAPAINDSNTKVDTNTRIILALKDDNEITAASAEDLANYKLTYGSNDANSLEITAAKLVEDKNDTDGDDDDEDMCVVELTTAPQKSGTRYKLSVNNLVDTSVLANKMTKADTINLTGKKAEDDGPKVKEIKYLTNKLVQVEFTDNSRLDFATLQDVNNYSVNNDTVVEKVELKKAEDPDCKTVRLTVSELGDKKTYKFTIENVADEYGNIMDEKTISKSFRAEDVNKIPTVSKVRSISTTKVELYFSGELDEKSAEDVANYSINNDIGTPKKAVYDDSKTKVTLTTPELKVNSTYEITINGVKDLADNALSSVKAKVTVSTDTNDIDAPEIEDIETVNKFVVRVTFNEPIDVDYVPQLFIDNDLDTNNDGASVGTVDEEKINDEEVIGTYRVSADDDDQVLEFLVDTALTNDDLRLVRTDARDLAGNVCEDDYDFAGSDEVAEDITLDSWEQANVRKFKIYFSEKVRLYQGAGTIASPYTHPETLTVTGANIPYDLELSIDDDDDTVLWLDAGREMKADKIFKIVLANYVMNYHDVKVTDPDGTTSSPYTELETGIEDEEAPYIEEVVATDREAVDITFSEELAAPGSYKISYVDDDGKTQYITATASLDEDVVTLESLSKKLEAKYMYTLILVSKARDLAGNDIDADKNDELYDFAGTNVVSIDNHITGVKVLNGSRIRVTTYSKVDPDDFTTGPIVATLVYGDNNTPIVIGAWGIPGNAEENTAGADDKTRDFTFNLENDSVTIGSTTYLIPLYALADGVDYTVDVDGMEYTFSGMVDDGVSVTKTSTGFEVDYDDITNGDIVAFTNATGILDAVKVTGGDAQFTTTLTGTVNVVVMRNGVVLYYAGDLDLPIN